MPEPHLPMSPDQHTERYWRAADEMLSWPQAAATVPRSEAVRSRLRRLLHQRAVEPALATHAGGRLQQIASGVEPASVVASPSALTEDIAFARCLELQRDGLDELVRMHEYLDEARPGSANTELATDHALIREQLSFAGLLEQPQQLAAFRAAFESFRREYARAYSKHHYAYGRAAVRLRRRLEEAQPAQRALARLNALRALGAPAGEAALQSYAGLLDGRARCTSTGLELKQQPSCSECSLTMDDALPADEAERIVRDLNSALATQQRRLASEAVRRILGRGGERIDQFLRIAQASDTAALARVLDDELLDFLRDLLAEPVTPTPEGLGLFEQLARAHPIVSEEQLDEVVRTLRQLLTEALAAQQQEGGSEPAAFRLASPPS